MERFPAAGTTPAYWALANHDRGDYPRRQEHNDYPAWWVGPERLQDQRGEYCGTEEEQWDENYTTAPDAPVRHPLVEVRIFGSQTTLLKSACALPNP